MFFGENTYYIVKALHIIAIISWMAGLLYLPRIFVYHCQVKFGSDASNILTIMGRKLYKYIINVAGFLSFFFGIWLIYLTGSNGWLHAKMTLVILLLLFHLYLGCCQAKFEKGLNKHSEKFYRIINEVPTIIMIAIIFIVVFKKSYS
ncbi:protoporphyrinogen oxidase HemJ [Rickettsiales bacterium]|nr:protoporphyrinogen oxidase HemJ [Rickettsiales bacterium]